MLFLTLINLDKLNILSLKGIQTSTCTCLTLHAVSRIRHSPVGASTAWAALSENLQKYLVKM